MIEVEIEVIIKAGLDLIMSIEVVQDIIKILRVEQHLVPNNRGSYGYNAWDNQRYRRYGNYRIGSYRDQTYNRGMQ